MSLFDLASLFPASPVSNARIFLREDPQEDEDDDEEDEDEEEGDEEEDEDDEGDGYSE